MNMAFRISFPLGKRSGRKHTFRIPAYCHIVLITSLVWVLIDVLVLFFYASPTTEPGENMGGQPVTQQALIPPKRGFLGEKEKKLVKKDVKPKAAPDPRLPKIVGMFDDMYQRDKNPPVGPGEKGDPVTMTKDEAEESKTTYKINQFNLFVCEKVSVNRSLLDFRKDECKNRPYRADLQMTSVVIVFHEEAWCTLIRSVYSIINRSPPKLLKEIILVDDASTKEHLKGDLDKWAGEIDLVKVVRLKIRAGLIRARLAGAELATGEVIVFLDSHIEATTGWLEPLLHEIREDRTRVIVPTIDNIDLDTFQYHVMNGAPQIGGFTWSLTYYWFALTHAEKARIGEDYSQPVRTPAMAGGLFAIERNYFYEIGSYDKEMEIWGGENIEISLRIWQCGGSIWIIPCSKVGHVFRKQSPYGWPGGVTNILGKNNRRLAEVWLEEYKFFWFFVNPPMKTVNYGDVSERLALKAKLKCKSFNWYIKNVWPESSYNLDVHFLGQIMNPETKFCMDTMGRKDEEKAGLVTCHGQGGHQAFAFTKANELRSDDYCLDASKKDDFVILYRCHSQGGNQYWTYDESKSKTLRHRSTNQCLSAISQNNGEPKLENCDANNVFQKWEMSNALQLSSLLSKYKRE